MSVSSCSIAAMLLASSAFGDPQKHQRHGHVDSRRRNRVLLRGATSPNDELINTRQINRIIDRDINRSKHFREEDEITQLARYQSGGGETDDKEEKVKIILNFYPPAESRTSTDDNKKKAKIQFHMPKEDQIHASNNGHINNKAKKKEEPIAGPIASTSALPSQFPTKRPTYVPLLGPNTIESIPPSVVESAQQSLNKSEAPSARPTIAPSADPTVYKSAGSVHRSAAPSITISVAPSLPKTAASGLPTAVAPSSTPAGKIDDTVAPGIDTPDVAAEEKFATIDPEEGATDKLTAQTEACTPCTDIPNEFMEANGRDCASFPRLDELCGIPGSWWFDERDWDDDWVDPYPPQTYCQYSCFLAGVGYPDFNNCCDEAIIARADVIDDVTISPSAEPAALPTPAPTPLPTPAPTPRPTPAPTPFPTPAPTPRPTPAALPTRRPNPGRPRPEPSPAPSATSSPSAVSSNAPSVAPSASASPSSGPTEWFSYYYYYISVSYDMSVELETNETTRKLGLRRHAAADRSRIRENKRRRDMIPPPVQGEDEDPKPYENLRLGNEDRLPQTNSGGDRGTKARLKRLRIQGDGLKK